MDIKRRKSRETRQMPLICKYRHRGMSKTNYRKLGKRVKVQTLRMLWEGQDQEAEAKVYGM